jgi:hypothetical protein
LIAVNRRNKGAVSGLGAEIKSSVSDIEPHFAGMCSPKAS